MREKPYEIRRRTFRFACDVALFCRSASEYGYVMRRLAGQLAAAAGSVGANLEEAAEGQSKADFVSKNYIALKECREARFWLRLIAETERELTAAAGPLIDEAGELVAILTAIVIRAKSNPGRGLGSQGKT